MNNVIENEKKIKENKKTSETQIYDDFENEEMENLLENSGLEESLYEKSDLFHTLSTTSSEISDTQFDLEVKGEENLKNFSEIKARDKLKERLRMVTGRKPKNIPNLKILRSEEETKEVILFGNRRPAEIEKERKSKWAERILYIFDKKPPINYGIIHHEIRIQNMVTRGFMCVRYQKNGNYLTTANRNGSVQIRSPHTGEVLYHLNTMELNNSLPVRGLRFHPNFQNKLYLGGSAGHIQVFNMGAKESIGKSISIGTINNLDLNFIGGTLVTVGNEGKIVVFDAATLQIVTTKQPLSDFDNTWLDDNYHTSRIYGLKFHPHNINIFVTGSWDKTVKVWDLRVPTAIRNIRGPMISGDSVDIRGETILTGSWSSRDSLHLWHLPSGKLIQPIQIKITETRFDGEFLVVCQFFKQTFHEDPPNNNLVAIGGSGFNNVDIIRVSDSKLLATLPAYKPVSSMDTFGNQIAYGGQESLFRLGELCYAKNFKSLYL